MSVTPGTRLGPYEIVSALGAGGMGEVYRARDTKLGRDVAIKVLPPAFAAEIEGLKRFRREAQILASLNHPNIAAIFGIEESEGKVALAMELVPGEDLADRLRRGPIPVEEALAIARQIADALEEAHEKGIVHRDLKPANIKLTPDGKVKVLDFGLAKAYEGDSTTSGPSGLSQSPTMSRHLTEAGMILGTAAYMSPEQARGRPVDKRADIWAFGVVLFEMLTGRRLFAGETVSDTLAAVLKTDPDWTALPEATLPPIRRLLRRCLDRDVKQRLRDIGEARLALAAAGTPDPADSSKAATPQARPAKFWLTVAIGCLLAGAAVGAVSVWRWRDSSRKAADRPARTVLLQAQGRGLDDSQAISPDGRWVAYTASGVLWIRNLAALDAREVKESRGAQGPFWSPRSDAVAFATDAALFKVSIEGEKPVKLCRLANGEFTGGSWSAVRGIVFTLSRANWNGDVLRVPEAGGEPEVFTRADPAKKERRLYDPHFLPDGRGLLYSVTTFDSNDGEIAVDRDGTRTLLGLGDGSKHAVYAPSGHLVFTRLTLDGSESALWVVPFSLETFATTGTPFLVARSGMNASASSDGTIVYGRYRPDPKQLVWVDRSGKVLGTIGEPIQYSIYTPSISPDGTRVGATDDSGIAIWDVDRGIQTRLTGESEHAGSGAWLPGGREFAYSALGTVGELRARRADGSAEPRVLLPHQHTANAPSFSPDGAFMAFYTVEAETARDLWAVAMNKPSEPFVILRTSANETLPRISPDGKFVAYESDASGRWEVHIQPFPRGEGRIQVSVGGGQHPMWNPRGGELFYVSGNDLMAVDVATVPALRAGAPRRLFGGDGVGTRLSLPAAIERRYDVSPDGRRFVVVRGSGTGTSDVVLAEGVLTGVLAGGR